MVRRRAASAAAEELGKAVAALRLCVYVCVKKRGTHLVRTFGKSCQHVPEQKIFFAGKLVAGIHIAVRRHGNVFAACAAALYPLIYAGTVVKRHVEMKEIEVVPCREYGGRIPDIRQGRPHAVWRSDRFPAMIRARPTHR